MLARCVEFEYPTGKDMEMDVEEEVEMETVSDGHSQPFLDLSSTQLNSAQLNSSNHPFTLATDRCTYRAANFFDYNMSVDEVQY